MAVNKVMDSTGNLLIDLTNDTIAPDKVLEGYTFHDRSGTAQTGTLVSIPQGPSSKYEEDNVVRFIDYNGEIVAEYSIAEANALQVLPTPPAHERLIFECWNHTLQQVQQTTHSLLIGALYNTVDDATYIHFFIPRPQDLSVTVNYQVTTIGDIIIDWGDATVETFTESSTGSKNRNHTYAKYGKYIIKITTTGDFYLRTGTNTSGNMIGLSSTHSAYITEFNFGTHQKHTMSFGGAQTLKYFSIGTTFGGYGSNTFYNCRNILSVFATLDIQIPYAYVFANGTNALRWISFNRTIDCNISNNFLSDSSIQTLILPENSYIYNNQKYPNCLKYIYCKGFASSAYPNFSQLQLVTLPPINWSTTSAYVSIENLPNLKTEIITISKDSNGLSICHLKKLKKVIFTDAVTKINSLPFGGILEEIDLTAIETPPTLGNATNAMCTIKVMRGTLSLYQNATNWSLLYADGLIEEATE